MTPWTEMLESQLSPKSFALLGVTAVTALLYYYCCVARRESWAQYGVKDLQLPKLYFVTGDYRSKISDLLTQHGDTVGIKAGSRLALITCNLDLLKNIMIKDFSNFQDRSGRFLTSTPLAKSLFFSKGSSWQRHRQIVSPTFTTGKLKHISKCIEKSAHNLAGHLEMLARRGTVAPVKDVCGQYTCEIIAKTAFGFNVDFIGKNEEFYHHGKNLLYISRRTIDRVLNLVPVLPQLCVKVFKLQLFDRVNLSSHKYFEAVLNSTIADRRALIKFDEKKKNSDFLDLLLKANKDASEGRLGTDQEELAETFTNDSSKPVKAMTDEEILGHSMLVIFAGLETTASTLQMCMYELALNPDIQEKVYMEILEVTKSEQPSHEEIKRLTYTEQVINETLRMYAPLPSINRVAKESITYNGITIPKGATVMIPLFHILMDPNIYPEPEEFDPDRFSSEEKEKRNVLAFMPFGQGPRQCLGMRLTYLELKQGLVHVLRRLRVVLNDDTTPKKGEGKVKTIVHEVLTPVKTIELAFELRSNSK